MRLIDSLDNGSDSVLIERVLSIISVEKSNSHLVVFSITLPVLYKILNLPLIHELDIIDVSIFLSFDS